MSLPTSKLWWIVLGVSFTLRLGSVFGLHTLSIFHEGFHMLVANAQGKEAEILSAGQTLVEGSLNRIILLAGYYGELFVFGSLALLAFPYTFGAFCLGIFTEIVLEAGGSTDFQRAGDIGPFFYLWIAIAALIVFRAKRKAPD